MLSKDSQKTKKISTQFVHLYNDELFHVSNLFKVNKIYADINLSSFCAFVSIWIKYFSQTDGYKLFST